MAVKQIKRTTFVENRDGVHLYSPFHDFTLCGDTDDGDDDFTVAEIEQPHETTKRVVTCPRCVQIILHCRGVRVAEVSDGD